MPKPIVIPGDVIAGMPQALRTELGIQPGRSAEVVAVTVPARDVPDVVRLLRMLASRLSRPAGAQRIPDAGPACCDHHSRTVESGRRSRGGQCDPACAVPRWPQDVHQPRSQGIVGIDHAESVRAGVTLEAPPSHLRRAGRQPGSLPGVPVRRGAGRDPRSQESWRYFPPTCHRGRSRSGSRRAIAGSRTTTRPRKLFTTSIAYSRLPRISHPPMSARQARPPSAGSRSPAPACAGSFVGTTGGRFATASHPRGSMARRTVQCECPQVSVRAARRRGRPPHSGALRGRDVRRRRL